MVAAAFNRLETASYLLSAGADRRKTNNDGASAEVIAAGKGFSQMVQMLRDEARAPDERSPTSSGAARSLETQTSASSGAARALENQTLTSSNAATVTAPSLASSTPTAPPMSPLTQGETQTSDNIGTSEISSQQDSLDHQASDVKGPEDIGDLIEFMRKRETYQMEQLKSELEANKQMLGVTISKHKEDTQAHEASLSDLQQQLTEAQTLEEAMKKDLKRITKDIEHLQRKDLETRNEISTQNRKFFHARAVQEKKVQESQEKLQQFMTDMRQRLEDRVNSSEGVSKERAPSMYDGLNMETELECPICFELSRPPIFQVIILQLTIRILNVKHHSKSLVQQSQIQSFLDFGTKILRYQCSPHSLETSE